MSLILEALRKSEAERRRGSTPDVAMELPPVAPPRARGAPAWLLPFVLVAGPAMLAAWWWSQRAEVTPANADEVAIAPPADAPINTPPPPVVVARSTPTPVAAPSQTPPGATPPPPATVIPSTTPAPTVPLPVPPAQDDTSAVADIEATALPPVKLSMHMWDASPGKRFVILDGQRLAEGERNGGLTVVAIERDGVVVERNGQRARVPLP